MSVFMAKTNVICPYCGKSALLVDGREVYPYRKDLWCEMFYICKPCGAWVGVHKDSKKFAPLGVLANAELREARIKAHAAFDSLWKNKMTRRDAYKWLMKRLGLSSKQCHIGMFDVYMCKKVVEVSKEFMADFIRFEIANKRG